MFAVLPYPVVSVDDNFTAGVETLPVNVPFPDPSTPNRNVVVAVAPADLQILMPSI